MLTTPPMTLPDFLDRYSIVRLKLERIGNEVKSEYEFYKTYFDDINNDKISLYFTELYKINAKIWDAEKDIRNGDMDEDFTAKDGWNLCLLVRDLNRERNSIKNKIQKETGLGFKEVRVNIVANPDEKAKTKL